MKIINKIICLLAFFAAGESLARATGAAAQLPQNQPNQPNQPVPAPAPQRIPAPAPQLIPAPAPQQPGQKITYKQLHDTILKNNAGIFAGNKFNDTYITQAITAAQNADIGKEGLIALLQTARDQWAPFTGNDADDLGILRAINQQIDAAAAKMQ